MPKSQPSSSPAPEPDAAFAKAQAVQPAPFRVAEDGAIVLSESRAPTGLAEEDIPSLVFNDRQHHIHLYRANCLSFMDALHAQFGDAGCFDVIFADPPYFLSNGGITCHAGRMVKVDKGDWDKSRGVELNHEFTHEWLARCQKVLKPNGTIWVTGTQHIIFSAGYAMQQLGYKILNVISWEKPNPPPNLSCRYFTHSTETVIWAAKSERSRHLFNYALMREANHGKQMKSVWRIKAPGKQEKTFGKHPAQKPVELVERCLLASSHEGHKVFDPFVGIATTAVAAANLGRACVGVDLDRRWLQHGAERIQEAIAKRKTETGLLKLGR